MKTRSLPCKRPGKECSRAKAWEAEPGGERDKVVWRGRWELCQAEQSFCKKDPLLLEGFSRAGWDPSGNSFQAITGDHAVEGRVEAESQ